MKTKIILVFIFCFIITPACYAADWNQLSIYGVTLDTSLNEAEQILGVKAHIGPHGDANFPQIDYKSAEFSFFKGMMRSIILDMRYDYTPLEKTLAKMGKKYGSAEMEGHSKSGRHRRTLCWGKCKSTFRGAYSLGRDVCSDSDATSGRVFLITIFNNQLTICAFNNDIKQKVIAYFKQKEIEKNKKTWENTKKKLDF